MHELSVTQSILNIALESAEKAGAEKINKIKIAAGEMTGYVPQYVQEYFNIVSRGTIAEGAELEFRKVPASALCRSCGKETPLTDYRFVCAHCGGSDLKLTHGREFLVDSIDID